MTATNTPEPSDDVVDGTEQLQKRKYESTLLDTPFLHIILEPLLPCLRPVMSAIFALRWQLSRPLQARLFPSCCPAIDFPIVRDLPYLTLGQLILALPLVGIFVGGYIATFVSPSVEDAGYFTSYAVYAIFLTANKTNSVFAFLLGIPFERMIPYHNLAALLTVTLACFHGHSAYQHEGGGGESASHDRRELFDGDHDRQLSGDEGGSFEGSLGEFLFEAGENRSGSLLALTLMILVATSVFPIFRRKLFDLWLWTHILAAICVIVFATMHGVTSILIIAAWWGIDVLTRYLVMATCRYPRKAKLELITNDVVKVSFDKSSNFSYNAGQFVQIAFPDIGFLEFHPLSISSAPHEETVTLHVKASGGWTKRLLELAKDKKEVQALVEGPYGSLSVDIEADRYQMALLVCGGIGVTPCKSVATSLMHCASTGSRQLKQLHFVWAVRELDLVTAIGPLPHSPALDGSSNSSEDRQRIQQGIPPSLSEEVEVQEQPDQSNQAVKTSIFLTKSSKDTPMALSDGRKILAGRPDLKLIVEDMKSYALENDVTHVAVFGCGPKALIDDLKDVCRKASQGVIECQGVTFDVHEEIFHF